MKIAYLIMTHENPQLLQRTIRTLSFGDDQCAFFIHLDRKTPFDKFSSISGQNVWFCEDRIPVYWGEFSQVEAILALMRKAVEGPVAYDYCVLITGSCYPLRTGQYIRRFLNSHRGAEYMDILQAPGPGKPISRFDTIRYPSTQPVLRFIFRALARLGLAQRDHKRYLGHMKPYSGDGAWALSREACQYILNFTAGNPHVEEFFRLTFAADESFLQTILGNSDFLSRMRRNLVYAVWPGPANGHPALISENDVTYFENLDEVTRDDMHGPGEMLFARKLNDRLLGLVDRIDAMIERKEGVRLTELAGEVSSATKCSDGLISRTVGPRPPNIIESNE